MNQPTYKKSFPEVQLSTPGEPLCTNKDIVARQRLNAAAPELLEALSTVLVFLEYTLVRQGVNPDQFNSIQQAYVAIKKAKGE